MNRKLKDGCGIVYLFTNDLLEKEHTYKYGVTIHPYQRKRIQSNATPPTHPFYNVIVLFSPQYKEIEKRLKKEFSTKGLLLDNGQGGREWITGDISTIVEIYKSMLKVFPETVMCYRGKGYREVKGTIKEGRVPNCRLDFLGILDGDTIVCTINNQSFVVKNNKIVVNDRLMKLSTYMKTHCMRNGNTNEYNGYQYFKYKKVLIYDMWQSLVKGQETKASHYMVN